MNNALPCLCTRESRKTQAGEVRTGAGPAAERGRGLSTCLVFSVEPSDNANQAVPSLNDLFKSGGVEGHASKSDYNQLCSEAAHQLAVFLNFPTVLRTVSPSSTDKNSLWGVKTLVDTDLDKQGHFQFKGETYLRRYLQPG